MNKEVLRSYSEVVCASDYEILTDSGWSQLKESMLTVPYELWTITTSTCQLSCADDHLVFTDSFEEVYVKDLKVGDKIITENGPEEVTSVVNTHIEEEMYDVSVDNEDHRFFANGILSHNSFVLGNLAARSFLQGNVTGLVTVELSDRQYMKRIGSNLLTVKGDEYSGIVTANQAKQLSDKINALRSGNGLNGELHIKEMMTGGATAIDIENYFLRLESKMNKRFKVIVVDYLNLLRPLKEQNGMYEKIKAISEELRGVAMRNEWCIISASQVKRDAVANYDLGMDSIAESFGLVHTVDSMYGLMRAPLESRMKIKVIANRDNGYEESYKFYNMHKDYFRLTEEVGHNSEFYSDDVAVSRLEEEVREENNSVMMGNSKRIVEPNYGDLLDSL